MQDCSSYVLKVAYVCVFTSFVVEICLWNALNTLDLMWRRPLSIPKWNTLSSAELRTSRNPTTVKDTKNFSKTQWRSS